MNKIQIIYAASFCLLLSSCATVNRTFSTSKTIEATDAKLIQAPVVVEISVDESKRTSDEIVDPGKNVPLEELKQTVVSRALLKVDGDVLLEPRFNIDRTSKGRIKLVSVSGYSARYKNFRPFELKDTILLEATRDARYRVIGLPQPVLSGEPAVLPSLFSSLYAKKEAKPVEKQIAGNKPMTKRIKPVGYYGDINIAAGVGFGGYDTEIPLSFSTSHGVILYDRASVAATIGAFAFPVYGDYDVYAGLDVKCKALKWGSVSNPKLGKSLYAGYGFGYMFQASGMMHNLRVGVQLKRFDLSLGYRSIPISDYRTNALMLGFGCVF